MNTKEIDVVILCGGLGKRLVGVLSDIPKSLARIGNRPFLDILIEHIADFGFSRFILLAGYKAEAIEAYYKRKRTNVKIDIIKEKKALGTGGSIKHARHLIKSNPFLVVNGDSFCDANLGKFLDFHTKKKALASVLLTTVKNGKEYGTITISDSRRILSFEEKKDKTAKAIINTGIYLFNANIFSFMPQKESFSVEYDLFPQIVDKQFYGCLHKGLFVDIGTPERYEKAKESLKAIF